MDDDKDALGGELERSLRRKELGASHVSSLTKLVDRIRADKGVTREVPYFDPCDGGTRARALFLLEAPGSKAVGSGFISRDNPDQTARNFRKLLSTARIPREETLLWNIVPWYIGTGRRIRPARRSDVESGQEYLRQLLSLLPRLRIVVLVGKKAQAARHVVEQITKARILETLHPSNLVLHRDPKNRERIQRALDRVRALLCL